MFVGSKHCAHCGATIAVVESRTGARPCPRGCGTLRHLSLGGVELEECERCSGAWLSAEIFQRLCAEEERRSGFFVAPVLGGVGDHGPPGGICSVARPG